VPHEVQLTPEKGVYYTRSPDANSFPAQSPFLMPVRLHALIPAAGSGIRAGGDIPKQYRLVAGKPILYYAIGVLARAPEIANVFVVLAAGDERFAQCGTADFGDKVTPLFCGGNERRDSVYNGLVAMAGAVDEDDWVLVHDAARPLLPADALSRLIAEAGSDEVGGLLAIPVADTLKRAHIEGAGRNDPVRVATTERRERMWQAQTPQMFRYGVLLAALGSAGAAGLTDEASAIERMGLSPRLVLGASRNIKLTWPDDLVIAEALLARQAVGT
jgi:2-C-methyl-D-erythritol 4-phosphate cytidylyltransferase